MRRVVVVGVSGSGKSTLARALSRGLGVPHVELDALFHGPGWQPRAEFVADVDAATCGEGWVVDGNYSLVRELIWSRADTVVWVDPPRARVMRQVVSRSVRRWALRAELWNGNRERARAWLRPSHPIRWAWTTYGPYAEQLSARFADPAWAALDKHRLRTRAEVAAFLEAATQASG